MIRVADYVMNRIYDAGVRDIFTVTGRGILFLTDALAKHEGLNAISVHNEQSGSFSAMGYGQANGQIGVCLTSTGCGSTNAITGVLCAYQDSVPCLYVSGQNMLNESTAYTGAKIRTYGAQEANVVEIVKSVTKYAVTVTDALKIAYEIDKALYLMSNGRPGPVWIDIPLDIQNQRIEPDELERFCSDEFLEAKHEGLMSVHVDSIKIRNADVSADDISYIIEEVNNAERPVILAGAGIRQAKCVDDFVKFVEKSRIPVVSSPAGADVFGNNNELSVGTVGSLGGTREGNFALQNADLILSIGCGLSSVITGAYPEKFARNAKLVVIDIDNNQHKKGNVTIDRLILSDASKVLASLNARVTEIKKKHEFWAERCIHWKEIFPLGKEDTDKDEILDLYVFAECLSNFIADDEIVVCDAGYEELIIPSAVRFGKNNRCIHPAAQGSMGYALGAAIGVYAATGKPVTVVVGDGSVMMNMQEFQTIAHYGMPIKVFVINNNVYSVIRKRQHDLFRNRTIGTNPDNGVSCPDFEKVAYCFELKHEHIRNMGEVSDILGRIYLQGSSVLCEVECQPDQRYLHMSVGKSMNGKVVHKPLEDMSPFLDRELFLSEMIIEPIDV